MPSQLALLLTVVFVIVLFRKDSLENYRPTYALWIPTIWFLILGSRPVSMWFGMTGLYQSEDSLMEGSPADRAVFLSLMAAGLVALLRRQIVWSKVLRSNLWLIIYFVFCGISIAWSDFPFVAFKRWFKALGDPMMILVVLSEPEPLKAVEAVIKRCTFLLIPFSILFIKYYPHLGQTYDEWTGHNFYVGVTTNKNALGLLCFAFGLFYFARFWHLRNQEHNDRKKTDLVLILVLFAMFAWCIHMVNSKTPLLSLLLGLVVYTALGYQNVRQNFGRYTVAAVLLYAVLSLFIDIKETVSVSVGRDPTLTGRTELWEVVLGMHHEALLGYGFESFWLGDRLNKLWEMYYFKPNMAHNGYLEVFLNLGIVGLGLFLGAILSYYNQTRKALKRLPGQEQAERIDWDRLRMAFLAGYLAFNVTEGGFRSLSFIFVFFLLVMMRYPHVYRKLPKAVQPDIPRTIPNAAARVEISLSAKYSL